MADNKENRRADDMFEMLNALNDDNAQSSSKNAAPQKNSAESSSVDEVLEILAAGKAENALEEAQFEEDALREDDGEQSDIPVGLFGHLSDEGDAEAILSQAGDGLHFTEDTSAEEESDKEEEIDTEEDDEEEEDSKVKKVIKFFSGMSFIPKALIYIAIVLIASAYLSYYIITIGNDVFALVTDSREVTITIDDNATDESVAKLLAENGIIEYDWVFEIYMKYRNEGDSVTDYISGEHTLNQNYNYTQIINVLTTDASTRKVVTVTIPEGFTVDQIIDRLVEYGIGQREDYITAINEYPYKWDFVQELTELGYSENRKYRLEGYLYPDTYDFYNDTDEVYVINKMLNAFSDKFWKDFNKEDSSGDSYKKTMLKKYGMTFDDVIVLASMIQSEGGNVVDFYNISYVFHNRLSHPDTFPKLESDATIQYVLPERIADAGELDPNYDSPYNTYLHKGLPPGAISNPGLEALNAALFPEAPVDSDGDSINAYFFVSNDAGKTYYASSRSGHEKNVAKANKDNEAIKAGTYGQ